ncbi:MAG TPA: hypothetical protein VFO34_08840 [Candidatus Acidoferrales bacterium]|nr:hypothetical protein [Candidatus Acidoferrales bacterium]
MLHPLTSIGGRPLPCPARRITLIAALSLVALATCSGVRAQMSAPVIGRISGGDFSVDQPAASAAIPTIAGEPQSLVSGSRITVRSGTARIELEGGGEILICDAGKLQLLSSGGAITIALDYGSLDLHLDANRSIAVYTALIVATPLTVGGGERETMIGLTQKGDMCLNSLHGAARIEQQFSGQSLLVPQFEEMTLSGGQVTSLNASSAPCGCRSDVARARKPQLPSTHLQETVGIASSPASNNAPAPASAPVQSAAPSNESSAAASAAAPSAPKPLPPGPLVRPPIAPQREIAAADPREIDVPVYKVLMPPLIFDSAAPGAPPEPSAETFVLVRSAHVQDEAVFEGEVAADPKRDRKPNVQSEAAAIPPAPSHGFFHRVGGFFRKIFGG